MVLCGILWLEGLMAKPKDKAEKARRVNIYISAELDDRLNRYCDANHGVARSRVIEDVLTEYLDREEKKKK